MPAREKTLAFLHAAPVARVIVEHGYEACGSFGSGARADRHVARAASAPGGVRVGRLCIAAAGRLPSVGGAAGVLIGTHFGGYVCVAQIGEERMLWVGRGDVGGGVQGW